MLDAMLRGWRAQQKSRGLQNETVDDRERLVRRFRADELSAEEYQEGGRLLSLKVARLRPRWLAVVGVTAYRAAFDERRAHVGPQERTFGDTRVWVLPNPSGLNAHWTAATMAEEFGRLRAAAAQT